MKSENRRIFISDLPETYTKELLESSFSNYGQVSSIEIKERKELGVNNKSLFFAYVNLTTDDAHLNQCLRDLSNTKWHGQFVQLQIARESFLDRLRRERQEAEGKTKPDIQSETATKHVKNNNTNGLRHQVWISKKYYSSSESETNNSGNETDCNLKRLDVNIKSKDPGSETANTEDEKLDIVIKSNKNKLLNKGTLKIPSVGKTPIHEISKKVKVKENSNGANLKRLESLHKMKKSYETQKSVIKNALSYSSNKPNNKIVFDDGNHSVEEANKNVGYNGFTKKSLFNEDNPEDSDMELNFDIKRQFEGKNGQKLLELQSKYKNDRRFTLDERFIDEQNEDKNIDEKLFVSDDNLEAEKTEQMKILEDILGKKVTTTKASISRKTMLKFDPSHPEHSNFELSVNEPDKKKKKKEKSKEEEPEDSKKSELEVSKEVFYKVPEKLKETFTEKQQFSLLSMFGRKDEVEEDKKQVETVKELKRSALVGDRNPFKYDSSDEEDEIIDIPHKDMSNSSSKSKNLEPSHQARPSQLVFWTEPFFFKHDDFRLREGLDFIEKVKTEDKEFGKIRRELKGIVKAKVRNSERKNKMFKKKLGGNKRRRHIRIKKALKR